MFETKHYVVIFLAMLAFINYDMDAMFDNTYLMARIVATSVGAMAFVLLAWVVDLIGAPLVKKLSDMGLKHKKEFVNEIIEVTIYLGLMWLITEILGMVFI